MIKNKPNPLINFRIFPHSIYSLDTKSLKGILAFAKKHNIKKVVLTSSVAAIFDTMEKKSYYDESDWSDPDNPAISHYSKSKTLAERAAWDFVENEGHPFELAVINPALVVGSSLSGDIGESNKAVHFMCNLVSANRSLMYSWNEMILPSFIFGGLFIIFIIFL